MSQMLLELVLHENPQLIQKYVNRYLPDDQNDLQRIYHELQDYQIGKEEEQLKNQVKERKTKSPKKKLSYAERLSQQNIIKQSKNIMLKLKDMGIRPNYDADQGLNIYEKKRKEVVRPLKTNPQARFIKKGKIEEMFKKFQLNKNYYRQKVQTDDDNFLNIYDADMREFIIRKKKLLNDIKQNKLGAPREGQTTKKYSNVRSRLFKSHQNFSSASTLPIYEKSSPRKLSLQRKNSQANDLIQNCEDYLKDKVKQVQKPNYFEQLQKKLLIQNSETQAINRQMKGKLATEKKRESYDRYTHTYMKLVVLRSEKKPNQCKMSLHEKDLLKDQLRLRKIFGIKK